MQQLLKTTLAYILAIGTVLSQDFNKPKLDSLLSNLAHHQQGMGCVTLTQAGRVIYNRAFGNEQITPCMPATPQTKYRIGSISKMLTATMIFQMIEEQKFRLNTPLSEFFPNIPNAAQITVGHLLNHRSGLSDIKERPEFFNEWMQKPHSQEEILAIIEQATIKYAPNKRGEYSNSGYILLSCIVEKVGKKSYNELLQQRICKKIGLKDTYYQPTKGTRPHESNSYQWRNNTWEQVPDTHLSIPQGAGGILSTTTDLTRFMDALFAHQLISQNSLEQMKIVTDGYGSGIFEFPFNNQKGYGHNGDIDGFSSFALHFPEAKMSLAYFTNGQVYSKDDILRAILKIYFHQPYSVPSFEILTQNVKFSIDIRHELGRIKNLATVGIRGNVPPLSWDQTYPMTDPDHDGIYEATITLTGRSPLEYKYHYDNAVWESGNNHRLDFAQTTTVNDQWSIAPELKQLYQEVLAADSLLFEAGYNKQNISLVGEVFDQELEFYHDRTGLTNYAQNIKTLGENFGRNHQVQRVLLRETVEIYPIANYGAVQTGMHRFCHVENGENHCGTFKFVTLWKKANTRWTATRIVSYNH